MLSKDQVMDILCSPEPYADIAERIGCSLPTVKNVRSGRTHPETYREFAELYGAPAPRWHGPLTREQVFAIMADPGKIVDVGKRHGCSPMVVSSIRHGKRYAAFHDEYVELYGKPAGNIRNCPARPEQRKKPKRPSSWLTKSWK